MFNWKLELIFLKKCTNIYTRKYLPKKYKVFVQFNSFFSKMEYQTREVANTDLVFLKLFFLAHFSFVYLIFISNLDEDTRFVYLSILTCAFFGILATFVILIVIDHWYLVKLLNVI